MQIYEAHVASCRSHRGLRLAAHAEDARDQFLHLDRYDHFKTFEETFFFFEARISNLTETEKKKKKHENAR